MLGSLDVREIRGDREVEVLGVTHDTRSVAAGALFCCVRGDRVDGHDLATEAVAVGAVALLCERAVDALATQVIVDDTREAMGPLAAAFHEHPASSLTTVAITGTNGKTTTAHLLAQVLTEGLGPTSVIGTLSSRGLGRPPNTPEAPDLQALLAAARDANGAAIVMEVSSIALVKHRVDGMQFDVAVFTNLSQDHLDFHGDMESYFAAKAALFDESHARTAVLNTGDDAGRRIARSTALPTVAFSPSDAVDLQLDDRACTFRWRGHEIRLHMPGRYNALNAIGAATAAAALGVDEAAVASALSTALPAPGRLERVDAGQPFTAFVDYAHTPDALAHALSAAREVTRGRVIVVFGCGGDRDRAKRPLMGELAGRLADVAIITSDNPRSEEPAAIVGEVAAGAVGPAELVVEVDRATAIGVAVARAAPGDVVLVAGKGHESGQTIGELTIPFDDRSVLADAIADAIGRAT